MGKADIFAVTSDSDSGEILVDGGYGCEVLSKKI